MDESIIKRLTEKYELIPVCPEIFGGLPTPREPSERQGKKIVMNTGRDVTDNYLRGAKEALRFARLFDCKAALLKERSPSCGSGSIYDGSFSGHLTEGDGATAELLKENGISVFGESRVLELL